MSKKPYPKEFRDDVVRVARSREPGVGLDQIAKDFGIHFTTLYSWMKKADIEVSPRYGQFDREKVAIVPATQNWLVVDKTKQAAS